MAPSEIGGGSEYGDDWHESPWRSPAELQAAEAAAEMEGQLTDDGEAPRGPSDSDAGSWDEVATAAPPREGPKATVSAEMNPLPGPPVYESREAGKTEPGEGASQETGRVGAEGLDQAGDAPPGDGSTSGESGSDGYDSRAEALRAGETAAELLREAHSEVWQILIKHRAEINQTAGLAEAVGRLDEAVGALSRTVAALLAELQVAELEAKPGDGSLAAVAVIQKPLADGAAMDALSVAQGPVKKALRTILRTLNRAGEWLWSMVVHLATIREWSIAGEVGLPGFAKASLTVTFGG